MIPTSPWYYLYDSVHLPRSERITAAAGGLTAAAMDFESEAVVKQKQNWKEKNSDGEQMRGGGRRDQAATHETKRRAGDNTKRTARPSDELATRGRWVSVNPDVVMGRRRCGAKMVVIGEDGLAKRVKGRGKYSE
ncbi:hypothetical protein PIB30_013296 [Stylosanthes scabra]|uniref:Uncharacterized protein n=1 Tax=Stylosanthes scabra TaxID=79078 RepID=A0ABU6S6D0_9FABA|nr:hypothetical protein [Stylosanthes scabra]